MIIKIDNLIEWATQRRVGRATNTGLSLVKQSGTYRKNFLDFGN